MSQLYLRFLRIAREVDIQKKPVKNIDSTALLLLNEIAVQYLDGKNITVTQAMLLTNIASPATIHRKLNELIEAIFALDAWATLDACASFNTSGR